MNVPTYDFPQSPILIIGFFGIFTALLVLYIANRDYFGSPLNNDKPDLSKWAGLPEDEDKRK